MKENEQIIEATGWHVWCDGDGVQKVDRCIRLGRYWHYHVIEDVEGNPADEWSMDGDQRGTNPLIFPTKDLAHKEEERQEEEYKKTKKAREAEEDTEDAPLVEKLGDMDTSRFLRVIEKAGFGYVPVWRPQKLAWESRDRALSIIRDGYITHTVEGKETIIPLGSIDHVSVENGTTRVTTKSGASFLYKGDWKYDDISKAISIFNKQTPF